MIAEWRSIKRPYLYSQVPGSLFERLRHRLGAPEGLAVCFEPGDAGETGIARIFEPGRIRPDVRDALLACNPHAAVRIFEESVLAGGIGRQAVLKLDMNPVVGR